MILKLYLNNGNREIVDINSYSSDESLRDSMDVLKSICDAESKDGINISEVFSIKEIPYWYIYYRNTYEKYCWPYVKYSKFFNRLHNVKRIKILRNDSEISELLFAYCSFHNIDVTGGRRYRESLKQLINAIAGILLTFMSLIFRGVKVSQVAVWSTYNFSDGKPYDFRIANVYRSLENQNVNYVRVVRLNENYKRAFRLWSKTDRPLIFTGSFIAFFKVFNRYFPSKIGKSLKPNNLFGHIACDIGRKNFYSSKMAIKLVAVFFRMYRINSALLMEPSERGLHEILAAKSIGIPSVALMNGVDTKYFHVHKFLTYRQKRTEVFSPEHFGVWSAGWREYFIENSKVIPSHNIEISGHLRSATNNLCDKIGLKVNGAKKKVLWIEEPHLPMKQFLAYFRYLAECNEIELLIKLRPYDIGQRSTFLDQLRSAGLLKNITDSSIVSGDIFETLPHVDIVVASHSTVILDALAWNVKVALFETKKWGDYFDLKNLAIDRKLLAQNPSQLLAIILAPAEQAQQLFKTHYIDQENRDGADWAVSKLMGYINE